METNRIPKVILGSKLEAKKKVRRPKLRWIDYIQAGFKMAGIKGRRRKAQY
jgi:hypothetical protein